MGGRGSAAFGNNANTAYKTVSKINGVKVLVGFEGKHSLPEESHTPNTAYIKLKQDGTFHEMRIYGSDCLVELEIAYHPEPSLNKNGEPVLHCHKYGKNGIDDRGKATLLSSSLYNMYKEYFIGVAKND